MYRIAGSIPAGNYIQFPRTSTQSLGLVGRYLYILFKPISGKFFVAHIDVATEDGLAIRISFSNLFKEFKSTSTWLQFPFVPRPPPNSLDEAILASSTNHGTYICFFEPTSFFLLFKVLMKPSFNTQFYNCLGKDHLK